MVTIDPKLGDATVRPEFGINSMQSLAFAANGVLYATSGTDSSTSSNNNRLYTIDPALGKATPIGSLADRRDYDGLACSTGASITTPTITSFTINAGAASTDNRMVTLTVDATSSKPIKAVQFVEYRYDQERELWTPAKRSDWLAYSTTTMTYSWQLQQRAGVKYIHAWAKDTADAVTLLPYQAFINYIPPTAALAQGEGQVYRYVVRAGERLTARIQSLKGDADLVVWGPNGESQQALSVSNLATEEDVVSLVALEDGAYQVEVVGATMANYQLTAAVTSNASEIAIAQHVGGIDTDKPIPSQPLVPLDSSPEVSEELPVLPQAQHMLYLPVVR